MSYQVLARKLRPVDFNALVGQDHVVRALTHALDHDRLHHAYLFTGTRGVGKTTIARILARSLNCEQGVSSAPCGTCSICLEVLENRFVDLIEVDAASRTGIDDTRELLENAQYLPSRGRYKVYLIDEVHMLSKAAFNALLKTLEEPPEHVKFLLATTDPKKVPITVLSRCLQFQLKNLSATAIAEYLGEVLQAEGTAFDASALPTLALSARGSMRDALSLADQAVAFGGGSISADDVTAMLGTAGRNEVDGLVAALVAGEAAAVLSLVAEFAERSVDFAELLSSLVAHLHGQAVAHAIGDAQSAPAFDAETVQLNYQIALMGIRDMQVVPDPQMGFEMTLLRMLAFAPAAEDSTLQMLPPEGAGGAGGAAPAAPSAGAAGSVTAAADGGVATAAIESALRPAPAVPRADAIAVPGDLLEHWYTLAASLNLTGVARLLVDHALAQSNQPEKFVLLLDADHDMLLSDAQVAVVQRALSERLGTTVALRITPAVLSQETPAQRNTRLQQERLQAAEAAIAADPTVQRLLQEFGGRVQQVKPLDD
ncbi:MAG: DNA polymerase III subunit gamma/tau [Pseudomonadales bacterium]